MMNEIGDRMSIIVSFILHSIAQAAPVLVTRTTGNVEIEQNGTKSSVPQTTFALMDDQTLHIPAGALATVVSSGKAEQITGPKAFTTKESIGSNDVAKQTSSLDVVLNRQNSAANVGATRSLKALQVKNPLPDSRSLKVEKIQWSCTDCNFKTVEVWQMDGFKPIWSGSVSSGDRALTYDGPILESGEYAIKIDDTYSGFEIIHPDEAAVIQQAIAESQSLSKGLAQIDQISIEVGLLWNYGLWGEAFQRIDAELEKSPQNEELKQLKQSYVHSLWRGHEK